MYQSREKMSDPMSFTGQQQQQFPAKFKPSEKKEKLTSILEKYETLHLGGLQEPLW